MKHENSLLIEQNGLVSIPQWEEIVRSVIMFSDRLWFHNSLPSFDTKLDTSISRHIMIAFNELAESGLISSYSFESDTEAEKKKASRVITREEHMELYNSIIERVQDPNTLTLDTLQDPERTSRIVEKRNELWKFGLATILDSDISMICKGVKSININSEIANRSLNSQLTNELFSAFEIPTLSHLTANDIVNLREKAKKYRKTLIGLTTKARIDQSSTISSVVENEFNEVFNRMKDLADDAAGNGAIKKLIISSVLNLTGLIPLSFIVVAPLTALLCGKDLYGFIVDRKKYGFVLFMNSVKVNSIKASRKTK